MHNGCIMDYNAFDAGITRIQHLIAKLLFPAAQEVIYHFSPITSKWSHHTNHIVLPGSNKSWLDTPVYKDNEQASHSKDLPGKKHSTSNNTTNTFTTDLKNMKVFFNFLMYHHSQITQ